MFHDLSPEQFRALRSRKIAEYFPSEQLPNFSLSTGEKETAEFVADLERLLRSRQGMQGRARGREFRKWWHDHHAAYLTVPVMTSHAQFTLSEMIDELYMHFLTHQARKHDSSLALRVGKRFFKNRFALGASVLAGITAKRLAVFGWSLAMLGPGVQIINSYTQPMVTPIAQTVNQTGARDLAPAASWIQAWLTNRDKQRQVKQVRNEIRGTAEQLKKTKFQLMPIDRRQAKWAEFEDTFFKLFMRYNQTLPSHLRDGRSAFKDFIILTPIGLASNLATFDTQYWIHRREFETLRGKAAEGELSAGESRLQSMHQREMEAAESRMAGTLAAWKLFEFMYPEYSRVAANTQDRAQLQNGYRTFVRQMRFDVYVRQFAHEMDDVLQQMDALAANQG